MSILAERWAGILLSFPAANNLLVAGILDTGGNKHRWCATAVLVFTRFLLSLRAVPEPIWALIFLFVLFPGFYRAIALALQPRHHGASDDRGDGKSNARCERSAGCQWFPSFPLRRFYPALCPFFHILYRWEVCIRATVIVGLVGGLGRLLTEQLSSFFDQVVTLICFIGLHLLVDLVSFGAGRYVRNPTKEGRGSEVSQGKEGKLIPLQAKFLWVHLA